jgi:tetratricopeptide (TPR) repeat protein
LAISNLNVGNILSELKDYPKAIGHLEKALKIAEEIKAKDQIAGATNGLGEIYRKLKNYPKAIKYSELSFKFAEQSGSKKDMKWALLNLSDTYNEAGNATNALLYYKRATALNDSILNEESTKQINELQTLYETEKKESQIKLLSKDKAINEKELQRQKVIRNAILAGAILFLLLLVVIFIRYREKKMANLMLGEKNRTIEMQKRVVEEKQKEILDSIRYAKRIQTALLPNEKYIARKLSGSKQD